MSEITLQNIGPALRNKRGNEGLRETTREIGISPATLSRVESGKLPDIETFKKICIWMKIDAGEVLGTVEKPKTQIPMVHLKAKKNLNEKTVKALSEMIIVTKQMFMD